MKKLLLIVALLALLVPMGALANGPKPKPKPAPAAVVTLKNSAWVCKSLRAQNPAAFAKAFGTNHNARNAYGKCVSAHARANSLQGVTLTFHNIVVGSTGTISSGGATGCQTAATGCTVTSSGTLNGIVGGTYTSTWTILWTQATSNGQGGYCAPATGTTTLTLPGLGSLTKDEKGTVCEVGATGTNVEHVLNNGTFTVSSGTGALTASTGDGSVSFDQKPGTSGAAGGAVTGSETFANLTVKL